MQLLVAKRFPLLFLRKVMKNYHALRQVFWLASPLAAFPFAQWPVDKMMV